MHTNISLLDIIFRYSLFFMLAYKLYELIQRYLIPEIFSQITTERKQHTELLEKDKLLVATRNRIENQIYTQKQMFTLLEKHVQTWHDAQKNEIMQKEKEQQVIIQKIHAKRLIQAKNIALSSNAQHSIPLALDSAFDTLAKAYSATHGKAPLQAIIAAMDTLQKPPAQGK